MVKPWKKIMQRYNTDAQPGYDPRADVCVGPNYDAQPKTIYELSREEFPFGHPEFNQITVDEMALHSRKNNDYARGGEPLGNFDRVSCVLANYPGLRLGDRKTVALVYALKQLDAAMYMLANDYDGAVEGVAARLGDVSVYSKLVICMLKDEKRMENGYADRG